jgi:diguanylate cyclase (GGDEF)-like protein
MNDKLHIFLNRVNRLPIAASLVLSIVLIALVGFGDYHTGYEFGFSIFYVVPVAFAASAMNKRLALVVAVLSAAVWLLADAAAGHAYSSHLLPYWNAAIRFAFFSITVFAVSLYKDSLQTERMSARTDSVTGLTNARGFYEAAAVELERMRRFKRPVALAYIDCDNFKQMNDTFGHLAGSEVLHIVGETMKSCLRSYDLPSRIGGDEFAVLLPETDSLQSQAAIEKLRLQLLAAMERKGWPVTFSIGVVTLALVTDEHGLLDKLMSQADSLMYEAKGAGKNNVVFGDMQ